MTGDAFARGEHLGIQRHSDSQGVALVVRGELDLASAQKLEQTLREIEETRPGRVLIDLRELEFMDCTGLALMVRAQQRAHARGHQLALRRGPRQVQRLFEPTDLLDQFMFLSE